MENKSTVHPIIARYDEIEKRGIVVFDNIHDMPVYNEPYTTNSMVIALNIHGSANVECDMRPVVFKEHDLAVVTAHHILCSRNTSPDYHAIIIVLSATFQEKMKLHYADTYQVAHQYRFHPDVHLDDEEFPIIYKIIQLLIPISLSESKNRIKMAGDLLGILFMHLQDYRVKKGIDKYRPSPKEELFARFYKLIEEHHRDSHEVKYYAELLCMSPKHFASIIKEHTGINALSWINQYVLIQAKTLLSHMQMMSIQQVSEQVGFTELASFSRFFKNNTGMTPSEFREKSSNNYI